MNSVNEKFPQKYFPWHAFLRIASAQALLITMALAVTAITARVFFKRQFLSQTGIQLHDALRLVVLDLPTKIDENWCIRKVKDTEYRLTVIDDSGRVWCDSHHDPASMENHRTRPEVLKAEESGYGEGIRYSTTLNQDLFYGAMHLKGRHLFARLAIPLSRLASLVHVFDVSLGFFLGGMMVVMGLFALWFASRLVFPLGRLLIKTHNVLKQETSRPKLGDSDTAEWSQIESNIEALGRTLRTKSEILSREQVELETIMSSISDAILAIDPEGNPLFYNSRFEILFGEGLGKSGVKLWDIFRDPQILEAFQLAIKEGKNQTTSAVAVSHSGGLTLYFSVSVSILRKEEGAIYGVVGIFHDVTDLKSAEQMRIDFVANVTHELRTPLTAIKGYTDTLIQDFKTGHPLSTEFLSTIARNTDRLMNLMNDLLDLSSIESLDVLQKEVVHTQDLTTRILAQLQGKFDAKDQAVLVEYAAVTLIADTARVEQVLVNLLDNANKYTPSGGKITVRWEKSGTDVVLRVSDTGPGIPVEHHGRLFERFYRVDKGRSRAEGGTGLGLAIVKHIMQRHGGTVGVESKMGQGSTFYCRFPNA